MKKTLLLLSFLILCAVGASAQSIQVGYIEMLANDLFARTTPRKDTRGKNCAALKIAAPGMMNMRFTGDVVGPVKYEAGIYYVYVPEGTKSIGFEHRQLGSGAIDFSSAGIEISSNTSYSVILASGSEDTEWQLVVFRVDPGNTSVQLDGKTLEVRDGVAQKLVPRGLQHHYIASAPGKETVEGDVPLSDDVKTEMILHLESSKFVDLGLSVKWASCNLGATVPEDFGDYYAWGETETKTKYDSSTYKGYMGDAATVVLGGTAHIPSKSEWQELIDNCTWTWVERNGIQGYRVESKVSGFEGVSIFLPAAGSLNSLSPSIDPLEYNKEMEVIGRYWSSTPAALPYANALNIRDGLVMFSTPHRTDGVPIRAVSQ